MDSILTYVVIAQFEKNREELEEIIDQLADEGLYALKVKDLPEGERKTYADGKIGYFSILVLDYGEELPNYKV